MLGYFSRLSLTARTICKVLAVMFVVFLVIGEGIILLAYPFEKPLPFAIGLFVGTVHTILKVALMEKALTRSLDLEGSQAKNYGNFQALLRYFITIAVFVCVILFPKALGLIGVIVGVLSLQPAAFIASRLLRDKDLDREV